MRARTRPALVGLAALTTLVAWAAGVPVLLIAWRHNPLPTELPSWERLTTLIQGGYLDPDVVPNTAAVVAWAAWAWVTACAALDIVARARHHHLTPPARSLRAAVGRWVAAAALVGTLITQRPSLARATPVPLHALAPLGPPIVLDDPASPASPASVTLTVDTHAAAAPSPSLYEVQPGDSYWRITERNTGSGDRWRELRDANLGRAHVDGTPF